ncbi:128aa long hypothetical protein [Pyrococcus horikoshii OT3]|uniref:Uncharacterized protein n=1 Tax=Pyrococcus horikoshii (strain ATCC 700860 / DSM 12428 / JCM 9974 / NBRC 100139 / OT-3) TaxID=70601 RepID=O58039_PYRHO|nr:128aa long hypothetical protein [Pyrococcus horikoshii OT3]
MTSYRGFTFLMNFPCCGSMGPPLARYSVFQWSILFKRKLASSSRLCPVAIASNPLSYANLFIIYLFVSPQYEHGGLLVFTSPIPYPSISFILTIWRGAPISLHCFFAYSSLFSEYPLIPRFMWRHSIL